MTIGSRGSISFTDLKAALDIGVGTLYYHLDALSSMVTQNGSKQYVLTDLGAHTYDYLKSRTPVRPSRARRAGILNALREGLFLETYVEGIGSEPVSSTGLFIGIFLMVALLSAMLKMEPTMLIVRPEPITPLGSLLATVASWVAVFAVICAAVFTLHAEINWGSLAICTSFAFIPTLAMLMLAGFRVAFKLTWLNTLYTPDHFPLLAIASAVWAVYLLTISLRSAVRLSFERSLVVTLSMFLINIGYLWLFPVLRL